MTDAACVRAGVPAPGDELRAALADGAPAERLEELRQQDWLAHDGQRRRGVYYTPPALADQVVQMALAALGRKPARVFESGCGCGAFFRALDRSPGLGGDVPCHGIEIDPVAGHVAASRPGTSVYLGDALRLDAPAPSGSGRAAGPLEGPFDLILGNPPFGSAIRSDTGRSKDEKRRFRKRFPLAARGAYDRCALFVELALERLSPDGALAMVLPRSFLASPAATALREALSAHGEVKVHQVEGSAQFAGADVHVCIVTVAGRRRSSSRAHSVSWSPMLTGHEALALATSGMTCTLGDLVEVRASATVAEAYEWKPSVVEREHAPTGSPVFVVSGSIDPGELLWGEVPTRYLGVDYQRPAIPMNVLSPRRRAAVAAPAVLVAGLSRVLEGCAVSGGTHCGAVATLRLRPPEDSGDDGLRFCEALVNSSWLRLVYRARYSALQLSGGNLQATRRKLEELPIPDAWAVALQGNQLARFRSWRGPWLKRLPTHREWGYVLEAANGAPIPADVGAIERAQFTMDAELLSMSTAAREAITDWLDDARASSET